MDPRIGKIIERWYITEPALFQVYCTHNLEQNSAISCPMRSGRGKIEYNKDLVSKLTNDELEAYLKAEIIRILLKHPYDRQPFGCKQKSISIGSNLVLSDNYDFGLINLPKPSKYGLKSSESFEWYTFRIEELSQHQPKEDKNGYSSNQTDIESQADNQLSQNFDNIKCTNKLNSNYDDNLAGLEIQLPDGTTFSLPYKNSFEECGQELYKKNTTSYSSCGFEDLSDLWEEDSVMQCMVDVAIDEIVSNHSWGSLSGNVSEIIIANTKAKVDYRKILAGFRASILSTKRHLTRMKPNRRSGFENMGSVRQFDTNLLVAVDVSGSITNNILSHFYSVINRAFKYGIDNIDVIQFDTELKDISSFKKAQKKIGILGRGGTSFQPLFDYVGKHSEYDGLIVFTDGCASEPIVPKRLCKVVWVLKDKHNYELHKSWMRRIGRCCLMEL